MTPLDEFAAKVRATWFHNFCGELPDAGKALDFCGLVAKQDYPDLWSQAIQDPRVNQNSFISINPDLFRPLQFGGPKNPVHTLAEAKRRWTPWGRA